MGVKKKYIQSTTTKKRPAIHILKTFPAPDATNFVPSDIVEVNDFKILLHQNFCHENQWKTNHLTAKHLCHRIHSGRTPEHHTRVHPEDENTPILAIPFEVTWQATWLSEDFVKSLPNGNSLICSYMMSKPSLRNKTITNSPTPTPCLCGWHPQHTTYTTPPIHPGLDIVPIL